MVENAMTNGPPVIADVLDARRAIAPYLQPTPLHRYPLLDQLVGAEVYVKHENHQPIGAFKVRGGINLLSRLTADERRGGVFAASTGNHGQSISYAARLFGIRATIYVPIAANPVKVAAIRALGATVVEWGVDFDEARERCTQDAGAAGGRYVHHGDEPLLLAGVATEMLEILEAEPRVEMIFVPLGAGSGAAGACVVTSALSPSTKVIAVQSEAAPAGYRSWRARELVEDEMRTVAEGLATRSACALPQQILWEHLDDFVLVSEDELREATLQMIELTRNLVEPAGAAPLAGALRLREEVQEARIALICSGGNISPSQLTDLLAWGSHRRGRLARTAGK
jgi:threonine dehydratase